MSSQENEAKRYREAEELFHRVEKAVQYRDGSRAQERERLERLHAEEAQSDHQALEKIREIRAVRMFYLTDGPERHILLARRLYWLSYLLFVLPAALGWIAVQEALELSLGVGGFQVHLWCGLYSVALFGVLAVNHHTQWAQNHSPRVLRVGSWVLAVLPLAVTCALLAVAWSWGALLVVFYAVLGLFCVGTALHASWFCSHIHQLAHQAAAEQEQDAGDPS